MATVLIVEDQANIRKLYAVNLRARHYNVLTCDNAIDGLATLREQRPDIMLLDLKMPEMDGRELLDVMAQDPAIQEIPVLVVTASLSDLGSIAGEHENVVDVLLKPVQITELVARVDEILGGK